MSKALVLLSGGIDSTTCLHKAAQQFTTPSDIIGLSVDYGQRHHREIDHAKASCERLGARHDILDLSSVIPQTMLTDSDAEIPNVAYSEIEGVSPTYVPYRNGLLLSAAASFFHGLLLKEEGEDGDESALFIGTHAEDSANWAYPDCSPEFVGAMANAINIGTYGRIRLHTPLQWLNKKDIILLGESLGVDWKLTWSCYKGGDAHCGECPTCRARRNGFIAAGISDPTEYLV